MNLDDLIDILAEKFPDSFREDNFASMEMSYKRALRDLTVEQLEEAFDHILRTWKFTWPPQPAHFLDAAPKPPKVDNRENMKQLTDAYKRLKPMIIGAWFLNNHEELQRFIASFDEADAIIAHGHVRMEIERRAHDVAMARARGREAQVGWGPADWETCRQRAMIGHTDRRANPYTPGMTALLEKMAEPEPEPEPEAQTRLPYAD